MSTPELPPASSSQSWIDLVPPDPHASDVAPAGFLRRWAAFFIDQLLLSSAVYTVFGILFFIYIGVSGLEDLAEQLEHDEPPLAFILLYVGAPVLHIIAAGLYYSLMESSRHQATVGKMALGIKVTDAIGQRINFGHALGRWFAAALSYLTLYIGFLMAAFTRDKRALHDMIAGTQVVDRWAYTENPERQQRGLHGCALAVLLGMILLIVAPILGILAAIAIPAYRDYQIRAHSMQLDTHLSPLRAQVEAALENDGRCPTNQSPGFHEPHHYAIEPVLSRIVIDEFEPGFCGIMVWMPPVAGSVERQFLAELDMEDGSWHCTDKAGLHTLPAWCE